MKMMITFLIIITLIICALLFMRLTCTGLYSKVLVMYADASGRTYEKQECRFKGFNTMRTADKVASFADNAIFDLPPGYSSIEEYLTKNRNKEIVLAGIATYTASGFPLLDVQRRNGAEKALVVVMEMENNKWPKDHADKRVVVTGTITEEKVKIKTQSSEVLPVLYKWVMVDPKVRLYSASDQPYSTQYKKLADALGSAESRYPGISEAVTAELKKTEESQDDFHASIEDRGMLGDGTVVIHLW